MIMIGAILWIALIFIICIAINGWAFIGMLLSSGIAVIAVMTLVLWIRYKITGKKPDF